MLSASTTPEAKVLAALPIFPLPNVVLLPGMLLPLNVFEPRYLELVDHVLADGLHIGVPLLRVGERGAGETSRKGAGEPVLKGADHRPSFEPVFGLGKLVSHVRMADGRRLIRLEGLGRVRLLAELPSQHRYRLVATEALPEPYIFDKSGLAVLRAQIVRIAQLWGEEGEALRSLLALPDPRVLLYALTAFLPSLELLAGRDVSRSTERQALVELQQRSLAADSVEDRLAFLTERTAEVLTRLGHQASASPLPN